jgi:vancomycin resistance protein YoaR
LQAAVDKINNVKIPNDAVFSFNQTVGKRTVTAGYETAKVIQDGEFVDGLGGGVCQVSSTVFECVLRANMDIVRRTNHSLKISYVPLGGDATVQWNSKDFQFKNNLGCDVRLKMTCKNGKLTCSVYAKEDIDVGKVVIKIKQDGENYVLTRTVNGKKNYTTTSHYKEQ